MALLEIDADVVIANLFARGIVVVSYYDLKVICNDLNIMIPVLYFAHDSNTLAYIAQERPDMFKCDDYGIRRGAWSRPEEYLRNIVSSMYLPNQSKSIISQSLVDLLSKGLEDDFLQVFTQDYVDKYFNWRIPDENRERFIEIIDKHIKSFVANTQ